LSVFFFSTTLADFIGALPFFLQGYLFSLSSITKHLTQLAGSYKTETLTHNVSHTFDETDETPLSKFDEALRSVMFYTISGFPSALEGGPRSFSIAFSDDFFMSYDNGDVSSFSTTAVRDLIEAYNLGSHTYSVGGRSRSSCKNFTDLITGEVIVGVTDHCRRYFLTSVAGGKPALKYWQESFQATGAEQQVYSAVKTQGTHWLPGKHELIMTDSTTNSFLVFFHEQWSWRAVSASRQPPSKYSAKTTRSSATSQQISICR
jgi:hypothetical protein